jgi:5-methylcytosine-specific restriction endonuclease McrA
MMKTYKTIVTLTWKFDSNHSYDECLLHAKNQLDEILNLQPQGKDFENFTAQVDLVKMRERKKLIHIAKYSPDDIFPHVTDEEIKKEFIVGDKPYQVKMNSNRYHVFKKNRFCVSCGIEGIYMFLDMNPGDSSPHFNLYAEEHGRLVLMTKDHIVAKSKGGNESLDNFQTCCSTCNNLKANYDLCYEDVRYLRSLLINPNKLSKKDLREFIHAERERLVQKQLSVI